MLTSQRRVLWQGTKKTITQAERWLKKAAANDGNELQAVCTKLPTLCTKLPTLCTKLPTIWLDGSISATPRPTNTNEVSLESSLPGHSIHASFNVIQSTPSSLRCEKRAKVTYGDPGLNRTSAWPIYMYTGQDRGVQKFFPFQILSAFVCTTKFFKVENNSFELTRIFKESFKDQRWAWEESVRAEKTDDGVDAETSLSLTASLSLFSALTLSSHAHLWSLKLSLTTKFWPSKNVKTIANCQQLTLTLFEMSERRQTYRCKVYSQIMEAPTCLIVLLLYLVTSLCQLQVRHIHLFLQDVGRMGKLLKRKQKGKIDKFWFSQEFLQRCIY